jgi:hypothetical protein
MSTAVKEKKPFLPTRKPAAAPGNAVVRTGPGQPVRTPSNDSVLTLGGEPRVHLLPLDVSDRKRLKALQRRLLGAVVVVCVLAAGAYGAVAWALANAQTQLTNAQSETSALLTQQGKYGEVTKIKTDIGSIQAAQKTATAQEILWAPYVTQLEATLPAGTTISTISGKIDTPFSSEAIPSAGPLLGPHIATIGMTLSMVQGTIPGWLNSLPTTTGFVDDSLQSVTSVGNSQYTVTITIYVDDKALSNRFSKVQGATK